MNNNKKITALIENSIPKFVTIEYPRFVEFLKVYYSQQELQGQGYEFLANLLDYNNIDETTLEFLENFSKQYLAVLDINNLEIIDKRNLIKNIKQFYQSIGTEQSIKFLFRILFNEDVSIYHPTVDILRPSDGKWQNDFVIKVTNTARDDSIANLEGCEITGSTSGARAVVELVKTSIASNGYFVAEIYLSDFDIFHPITDFIVDETITGTDRDGNVYSETILSILTGYEIITPGIMNYPGDFVKIRSNTGVDASVLVDLVTDGSITGLEIVTPGIGYAVDEIITFDSSSGAMAKAKITSVDGSGGITGVEMMNIGYEYETLPEVIITTVSGEGAVLFPISSTIGGIKKVKFLSFGVNYRSTDSSVFTYTFPINFSTIPANVGCIQNVFLYDFNGTINLNEEVTGDTSGAVGVVTRIDDHVYGILLDNGVILADGETLSGPSGNAVIYKQSRGALEFTYGALGHYDGYFRTTDSFLSTDKYLQDSYYYQDFSYVINTTRSQDLWMTPLKELIHPAGSIVFASFQESTDIVSVSVAGEITPLLDTTEFYKFRVELPQYDEGELSLYSNTPISFYDDYALYEVGYLDNTYPLDPDNEELNIPRKTNICYGSEILIGSYELMINIDEINNLLIDDSTNTLISAQG